MLDLPCLRRLNGQNSGVLQDLRVTMTSLRAWTLTQMWCRLQTTRRAQTRDATIETSTQMQSRCNNEFLCVKGTTKVQGSSPFKIHCPYGKKHAGSVCISRVFKLTSSGRSCKYLEAVIRQSEFIRQVQTATSCATNP